MASKTFRGVIFDLFGTLIENLNREEFEEALARTAQLISVNPADFIQLWNETWAQRSVGFFGTLEQDIGHISRVLFADTSDIVLHEAARILKELAARVLDRTRDDAVQTFTVLKKLGFKTGLISNCAANIPSVWKEGPLARFVDAPIFSCSVGMRKPNHEVYALTCNRLGLSPDQCLFIADGNERELTGASQAGLHSVLFKGPDLDPYDKGLDRREWTGPSIAMLGQIIDVLQSPPEENEEDTRNLVP